MVSIKKRFLSKLKVIKPEVWLVLIILFSIILKLIFFIGIHCVDDFGYTSSAYIFSKGDLVPHHILAARVMHTYPTAASFYLFGVNESSAVLWPFLCSIGLIILAFLLGKLLFNPKVGLFASFLISIFPLDVFSSTRPMPDIPVAFFAVLSVFIFLYADLSCQNPKKKRLLFVISGLVIGLAYLVKVTGVLVIIFPLVYSLIRMIKKKEIVWDYLLVPLGLLSLIFVESIIYSLLGKEFMFRYSLLSFTYDNEGNYPGLQSLKIYPDTLLNKTPVLLAGYFYFLVFGSFLIMVFLMLSRFKFRYTYRNFWIPALWFIAVLLYMQYGTMSLFSYRVIGKEIRYMTFITIPACLVLACFLNVLFVKLKNKTFSLTKKMILAILLLFITISSVYFMSYNHNMWYNGGGPCNTRKSDAIKVKDFLFTAVEKPIYAQGLHHRLVEFYYQYQRHDIKDLAGIEKDDIPSDAYIILNSSYDLSRRDKRFPDYAFNVPSDWKKIFVVDNPDAIQKNYKTTVYYAPPRKTGEEINNQILERS